MKNIKNKTNILFWAQLPPPIHGASLRNESVFLSKLINDNFNIKYIPFNYSKSIEELGNFSIKKLLLFFKYFFNLIRQCIVEKYDYVYFTYNFRKFGVPRDTLFVAIFRLFKIPIIFHFRNQGAKELSKNFFYKKLISFSLKKGKYICLSEIASKDIEGFINQNDLYIVNNGIKSQTIKFKKNKSNWEKIRIFYISNLRFEKGIYTLLDVYELLSNQIENSLSLTIVGQEGDVDYQTLQKYIDDKQIKNVNLVGAKFGKDKYNLFLESDIFFYPTKNDVFPGVILEAMQFQLPIITTKVGSIPDIIKNNKNGILCDLDNKRQMLSALIKLIKNKNFAKMIAKKARTDFLSNYTLECFEKNMLKVFCDIDNKNEV